MTEENTQDVTTEEESTPTISMDDLKLKADRLGVKYKSNTKQETLQANVSEALAQLDAEIDDEPKDANESVPMEQKAIKETKTQREARIRKNMNKLVRVTVTCHDPNKVKWDGEIISAGNSLVQIKKHVKFNVPYHVPQIILNVLEEKKFQQHSVKKDPRTGRESNITKDVPAFSIKYENPLSPEELKELAQHQALEGAAAEE